MLWFAAKLYGSFSRQWINPLICKIAAHVMMWPALHKKCSPFNARLVFVTHFWPILVLVWMVHCRDSDPESERINTVLPLRGINPRIDHLLPGSHMSFLWSAWHSCTESIQKYSSYRAAHAFCLFILCQCLRQPNICVCVWYCCFELIFFTLWQLPRHVQTAVYEESKLEKKRRNVLFNHKEPGL